jgi:L-lysine 6-transaminase
MELRNLAYESEFLLIYDEVQTGVGVTGNMWAHQAFGNEVKPDIISFGKKTQVCGIFASERLDEVENNVFHESSRLNSTWGGNLVDMVRFTIYLEIIENENLVQNAYKVGEYLSTCLDTLQDNHRDLVSNSRNRGLFGAFDLSDSDTRDKVIDSITNEGVMMLGCGKNSIRFRPHLNITTSELDRGFEMIHTALSKL